MVVRRSERRVQHAGDADVGEQEVRRAAGGGVPEGAFFQLSMSARKPSGRSRRSIRRRNETAGWAVVMAQDPARRLWADGV